MRSMQEQLTKYKDVASDVHSLRADVQSLSDVFNRKVGISYIKHVFVNAAWLNHEPLVLYIQVKEVETLSVGSSDQVAEMKKLQSVV